MDKKLVPFEAEFSMHQLTINHNECPTLSNILVAQHNQPASETTVKVLLFHQNVS
jgi:hypothetical protein